MKNGLLKIGRSKEIFLKGDPVEILTPIGTFYIMLDIDNKMVQVQVPDGFKLGLVNGIDIAIGGDLDIDSIGEVNIATRGSDINIDSLGASIYLNSLHAKQTRDDPNWDEKRTELMETAKKKQDEIQKHAKHICNSELLNIVMNLTERVKKLELAYGQSLGCDSQFDIIPDSD